MSIGYILNMSVGFMGIQFGFALQNSNVTRIFQTLGAGYDDIPLLWIAAPLTGLLIQPVIGYLSDRTWNALGRRRPYFLAGAILATLAIILMPNAPALWVAACALWLLDASLNVSMEPLRAFVADQLSSEQRPAGYAMQSFFIGIGSIVASLLPWLFAHMGMGNTAPAGEIPDTVKYSFYFGAAALFGAVSWTVLFTREYAPDVLAKFDDPPESMRAAAPAPRGRVAVLSLATGLALIGMVYVLRLDRQLYLLAALVLCFAILQFAGVRAGERRTLVSDIVSALNSMPTTMRQLAVVQFFSWFSLFAMWIYTTPGVAETQFGSSDPQSAAFNEGANWVGVLFAAYNAFSALAAVIIPFMTRRLGIRVAHLVNLSLGAAGLISCVFIRDPNWLIVSMIGVGFAWASILSLPYALLADSLPAQKMGLYMGVFNFFIVIPQLLAASVLGILLRTFFAGRPIDALLIGGCSWLVAGLFTLRVSRAAH